MGGSTVSTGSPKPSPGTSTIPTHPTSLSHDVVWTLFEDSEGTFWAGTNRGLNRFDEETETFTHFLPVPERPR